MRAAIIKVLFVLWLAVGGIGFGLGTYAMLHHYAAGRPSTPPALLGTLKLYDASKLSMASTVPPQVRHSSPPKQSTVTDQQPQAPDNVEHMILEVFGKYGNQALCIAGHESGFDPKAIGPYGEYGVFQILPSTWNGTPYAKKNPLNAWWNINAAWWIFQSDGYNWHEWATAKFCT